MRSTSILAYQNALNSGLIRKYTLLVYRSICEYPCMTQNEYHHIISTVYEKRPVNKPSITPLFKPLVRSNWILEVGEKRCSIESTLCLYYDITGYLGGEVSKINPDEKRMTRKQLEEKIIELQKEIEILKHGNQSYQTIAQMKFKLF